MKSPSVNHHRMRTALKPSDVIPEHVLSDKGIPRNEMADKLVVNFRKKFKLNSNTKIEVKSKKIKHRRITFFSSFHLGKVV